MSRFERVIIIAALLVLGAFAFGWYVSALPRNCVYFTPGAGGNITSLCN